MFTLYFECVEDDGESAYRRLVPLSNRAIESLNSKKICNNLNQGDALFNTPSQMGLSSWS